MEPKKNECSAEAPSQAVGQPDFHGISPGKVIYDAGDSFKRFMASHTKTLIKQMITKKIINKKIGKAIKSQENSSDLLLATMKKMSLEEFVTYLRLLLAISKSEEQETDAKIGAEKDAQKSLYVKTIKDDTINLMRIMKGSLEAMKPSPGSELHAVVAEFVYLVSQDSSDRSQTTVSQDVSDQSQTIISQDDCLQTVCQDDSDQIQTTAQPDVDLPPNLFKPPEGHLGNPVSHFFTNEGGTLYSPLHGVTVIIPPNAIPGAIPKFFLSMHFYLLQPFTLMDDADPCSVIVWLYQNPRFHFLEDVTVKIPHAAVVDDSLCVLTWSKDKQLNLNTEVPADFSDGYHAVIKVKHFCPKVTAKRIKPRQKPTKKRSGGSNNLKKKMEKLNSGSLETSIDEGLASLTNSTEADPNTRPLPRQDAMECDSPAVPVSQDSLTTEEDESGFKYSIACSMPSDRSTGDWKVQFAACQSNPTGISLLRKSAEEVFGGYVYFYLVEDIGIKGGQFEMFPETWSDNIWKIDASEKKASISEEQILRVSEHCVSSKTESSGQTFPNLPRLFYDVYHMSENDHSKLHCSIYARKTIDVNGYTPCFIITCTPMGRIPITKKGERVLFTTPYLYGVHSDIIRVLTHQSQDVVLDTRTIEHLKFLADISLQLSDTQRLCAALDRPDDADLDTFTVLGNWVASQGRAASLIRLKEQLSAIDIVDIAVCENKDSSDLLSPHLEDCFILDVFIKGDTASSYTALLNLSTKLQNCWRIVGRLLGILPKELDKIDLPEEKLYNIIDPPSYQLIFNWQRREGRGATFGALFKAIHRVYHHQPLLINDAHLFCVHYVHKYLPIPVHVFH